jgi:dTDP-4-dehydrorhamnose 3,5-epimerase
MLQKEQSKLPEVLFITPKIFGDSRGFFYESFQFKKYQDIGLTQNFVQDNISRSCKNTVRGLHYQERFPQAKLVSVIRGEVLDVIVDIRKNSPTYGQWVSKILNDENHVQIYIPEGFAHGFCVLSENADFYYKCTEYYHPEDEKGIRVDDPDLKIDWGIDLKDMIISEKDLAHPYFKNLQGN